MPGSEEARRFEHYLLHYMVSDTPLGEYLRWIANCTYCNGPVKVNPVAEGFILRTFYDWHLDFLKLVYVVYIQSLYCGDI